MMIDTYKRYQIVTGHYLFVFFWSMVFLGSQSGWTQNDRSPPPLNPPGAPTWPTPEPVPPGFAPAPTPPGAVTPGFGTGNEPYFGTGEPSAPGEFDYFSDEEDFSGGWGGGGAGGGGGGGKGQGKSSFKLVEPSTAPTCKKWGNPLLGPTTFAEKGNCDFELERHIDQGKASIEELYDKIERFKLKKVIRGELKSRNEANRYQVSFQSLQKTLQEASKKGCTCKD